MFSPLVQQTKDHVRTLFQDEGTGHDWYHIDRVHRMAVRLAELEQNVNLEAVELGALLHDIADFKFHGGDAHAGSRASRTWLESLGAPEELIAHVCDIVDNVSFKGAGVPTNQKTLEGKIVQDADRLDAMGAIGIARTFAYGGYVRKPLYDPEIPPELHQTFEAYKNNTGGSLNHFYEKLLLLKDRLNTLSAKHIAESRHRFMEQYVERFLEEWEMRI